MAKPDKNPAVEQQGIASQNPGDAPATNPESAESPSAAVILKFRDKMRPILSEKYPDRNLDDDDEYDSMMDEYHTGLNDELTRHRESSKVLAQKFADNPAFAAYFMDVYNGEDLMVAAARHFGDDFFNASQDPERAEKIKQEATTRSEKIKQEQALADEQAKNWEQSIQNIDAYQSESGKSPEEMTDFMNKIMELHTNGIMGIFSKEDLAAYDKMLNYDNDVADAEEAGRIAGRNEQIEDKMKKVEPALPDLNGGGGEAADKQEKPAARVLANFGGRQSMRERGTGTTQRRKF